MRKILVTGGGGYVGIPLVRALVEGGHAVTVLDRFYFGRDVYDDAIDTEKVTTIEGDIRDEAIVAEALQGADTLIHLASLSNDPSCELREDWARSVNGTATNRLFDLAKAAGVRDVLFYSSCSVYGAGVDQQLREDSPTHPVSLYAELKLAVEEHLLALADASFRPLIFRNATLFGLSQRMRFDLAINVMTLYAFKDRRIFVLGGGEQWRPFLHVEDLVGVSLDFLRRDFGDFAGEVYNVGHPWLNIQIKDLAAKVADCIGDVELEVAPGDADRRSYRVAFGKLEQAIDYTFRFDVEAGVKEIYDALVKGRCGDLDANRLYNIRSMREFVALPALLGGERSRSSFLPFCLPKLGKEEEEEVVATLRSGWITTGPRTQCFEAKLGDLFENKNTIALSSCTAALHLALVDCGVGPGDEVITTPLTFASTANVIVHTGATPVFADIDPKTLLLDPEQAEAAVTERTKAIIPVDLAGQSCDMDAFNALAEKHNLKIIQDAAHSTGGRYKGKAVGALADYTCFSFYPIKNMTTGEGGALTFRDDARDGDLRCMSLHGMSKDAWRRYETSPDAQPKWAHYEVLHAGFKYNMTDLQSAIGMHQVDRLPGFLEKRRKYARMYEEAIADIPEVTALETLPVNEHSWHLFIILLDLEGLNLSRDDFLVAMKAENIGMGVHFRALHLMPFYQERFGLPAGSFPHAEWASERLCSLPLYPGMTTDDVYAAIEAMRKIISHYRKG